MKCYIVVRSFVYAWAIDRKRIKTCERWIGTIVIWNYEYSLKVCSGKIILRKLTTNRSFYILRWQCCSINLSLWEIKRFQCVRKMNHFKLIYLDPASGQNVNLFCFKNCVIHGHIIIIMIFERNMRSSTSCNLFFVRILCWELLKILICCCCLKKKQYLRVGLESWIARNNGQQIKI